MFSTDNYALALTAYTRSFSIPFLCLGTRLIRNKNKMPTCKLLKPTFDKCHQLSICRSGSNDNIIGLRRCCFHWPLCAGESIWHHCSVSLQCTTTSKQCKEKTYAQQFISSPSVSLNAPPLQNSVKEKHMLNSSLVAQLLLKHSAIEREENLLHYYEV